MTLLGTRGTFWLQIGLKLATSQSETIPFKWLSITPAKKSGLLVVPSKVLKTSAKVIHYNVINISPIAKASGVKVPMMQCNLEWDLSLLQFHLNQWYSNSIHVLYLLQPCKLIVQCTDQFLFQVSHEINKILLVLLQLHNVCLHFSITLCHHQCGIFSSIDIYSINNFK